MLKRFLYTTLTVVALFLLSNAIRDIGFHKLVYDHIQWDEQSYLPEYDSSKWNILLDQHSHTIVSDGLLTPDENIRWHIAMGYNAMVLTDHNQFGGIKEIRQLAREKYADKIVVLAGVEWTTDRLHMNLIFPSSLSESDLKKEITHFPNRPTNEEIQSIIESTHNLGGLVTINHIPWSEDYLPGPQPSREELLNWGVDYIEVLNEHTWDQESYDFARSNGLGVIVGTDMHSPGYINGWTLLQASSFTEEAVFEALRTGQTEILYLPEGTPYPYEHEMRRSTTYTLLQPFIVIGDYFTDMTWPDVRVTSLLVLFGWVWIGFFIIEGFKATGKILMKRGKKDV